MIRKAATATFIALFVISIYGCAATEVSETKNKTTDAVEKYNDSIKERTTIGEE